MKATEFRVGNVFKDKEGNILTCIGVTDESHENKGIVWYGEELRFYLDLDECNAIPLTEQWLIDFGWGKGEYDSEFVDNVSLKQEVLGYNVNAKMFCIETNSDVIEITHILYVHQLQNIYFALTGNELTLNQEK